MILVSPILWFYRHQKQNRKRLSSTWTGLVLIWAINLAMVSHSYAEDNADISVDWGGYLRAIGTLSYPDNQSVYRFIDSDVPFFDRQGELRLKNQIFIGSQWTLSTHYELVGQQGDTLQNNNRLRRVLPAGTTDRLVGGGPISDDRRLMNLSHTLSDENDFIAYHRLDRLNLTYAFDRGSLRLGRQALTWGSGLIFNPMDLFNPFSPTAVQRDYKVGDDMLLLQLSMGDREAQFLYLPRRDPQTGRVENDQSSFAGKWHFPVGNLEVDIMAAGHFDDLLFGMGASGYWGGAAWRSDIVYTLVDDADQDDFFQLVANLDYAWQWGEKNIYGLIEFFYNGLGEGDNYDRALFSGEISSRIERGELFTLGRTYVAGQLSAELHPLMQTSLTAIVNIADPSAIFQPLVVWDIASNFQCIVGANINVGSNGTEFGGFDVGTAAGTVKVAPADSRYLWLTYYF